MQRLEARPESKRRKESLETSVGWCECARRGNREEGRGREGREGQRGGREGRGGRQVGGRSDRVPDELDGLTAGRNCEDEKLRMGVRAGARND
eukprot:753404-Hanusia_phi.AAC.2